MDEDLERERQALVVEHANLEAEYARLRSQPRDIEAHRALSARLHDHSLRLHSLIERLERLPRP